MHIAALIAGIACLWIVLLDAFQTIILPRRASGRFRLTGMFYFVTWRPRAATCCAHVVLRRALRSHNRQTNGSSPVATA